MDLLRLLPFTGRSGVKPPTALPLTLNRKRIYILPTRFGWLFIVVLLALLIGSVNYKNNLGFLLTFLLSSMAFVSIVHTYRNLAGIQTISVTAKPVFAGEQAVFKFHVRTDTLVRPAVGFLFLNGGETLQDINAGLDNWLYVAIKADKRGVFKPGILRIYTKYPFGLFRAWSNIRIDAGCLVYPKPIAGSFTTADNGNAAEGQNGVERPGVEDFQGLKTYQAGDPQQHIAWKAFSRGQGLFTKLFSRQAGASVMLDWSALQDALTEQKLSRLCGMVLEAHNLNLTYGLSLPGKIIDPDSGEIHRRKCLKALALYGIPSS